MLGQGRAVDRHKRTLAPAGHVVHVAGEHLLTSARLAGNKHSGPRRRHLLGQGQHAGNSRILADDARSGHIRLMPAQSGIGGQRRAFNRSGQGGRYFFRAERLKPVVFGAKGKITLRILSGALLSRNDNRREGRVFNAHGQEVFGLVAGQFGTSDDQHRSGLAYEGRSAAHVFRDAHFHIHGLEGGEDAGYGLSRRQK